MKKYFTVFTPTYNRAYTLSKLYQSLINQKFSDFEWLIVDDGSTDNTEKLINKFICEKKVQIRYIKKQNEGKHVAINVGAREARGRWFFIVDSDDILTSSALEIAKQYCDEVNDDKDFAGVVGLRGNSDGLIWNTEIAKDIRKNNTGNSSKLLDKVVDATPVEYRYKLGIKGDRAEIVKTAILKQYKFPSFNGEKFMPESYLWYSLSRDKYKFRWFNKIIYITEYLEDGLTNNGKCIAKNSCKSRHFLDNFSLNIEGIPFKIKYKYAINSLRYGKLSGYSWLKMYKESSNKIYFIIAFPVAIFTKIK